MSLIYVVIAFLFFVWQSYWMSKNKRNVITSHSQHHDWQNNVTPFLLYPKFLHPNSWKLWLIMYHGKGYFVDVIIVDTLVGIVFTMATQSHHTSLNLWEERKKLSKWMWCEEPLSHHCWLCWYRDHEYRSNECGWLLRGGELKEMDPRTYRRKFNSLTVVLPW